MNKKTLLLGLLLAGMMWTPTVANAAQSNHMEKAVAGPDDHEVTGTVEDADGPLIGATVKVVGAAKGTVTDMDGKFVLRCKAGEMLEISYVGYDPVQMKARQGMKVVMSEDKTQLSEVVVTCHLRITTKKYARRTRVTTGSILDNQTCHLTRQGVNHVGLLGFLQVFTLHLRKCVTQSLALTLDT